MTVSRCSARLFSASADGRTLDEQRRQRDRALAKLTRELERAEREYALLQPLVGEIKARYEAAGEPLPVPFATAEEMTELLDQAIISRDAKRIRVLEGIRSHNVRVHGEPARGADEIGRLYVQRREAGMDLAAHERRLAEFERTRHLSRWEIGGKTGWSLARVASERRMVEQGFNRASVFALLPAVRKNTGSELEKLAAIETEVRRQVDARRAELTPPNATRSKKQQKQSARFTNANSTAGRGIEKSPYGAVQCRRARPRVNSDG